MTRAGAVAEQIPVPSKVITERVREPGSQTDGATPQGKVEGEFSALLSKLKSGSDRHPDQSANDLPDGSSTPTEWRGARHRTKDAGASEDGGEDDAEGRAIDRLPRSDIDVVDAALLGTPSKTAEPGGAQSESPKTDTITTKDIADILSLTSSQPAAAKDQLSEASQGARPGVSPKAIIEAEAKPIIEASPGPETREAVQAAQTAPASKGQLDQKDAVRSRASAANATFTLPADVPKSTMPGLVVTPPARNDLPKANVVRQESHFKPVLPSAALSHAAVPAAAGAKLGTGSETKGNEPGPLPIDPGMLSAEGTATIPVPQPAQQIANRITTEVAAFEVVDRVGAEPNQVAGKPVLKILQIQLQPSELGTVTVRMELKDAGLELHVEAARAETAEIIRGDKATLSNLLRSSGYNVDANSIRVAEGDRTAASQQPGQQGAQTNMQSSAQPQYGGAERNAREHRGTGGSSGGDTSTQANRTDIHETNTSRASGGLYI